MLVTTQGGAERGVLAARARAEGSGELLVPRLLLPVPRLPLLDSGKIDYAAVQALAERRAAA